MKKNRFNAIISISTLISLAILLIISLNLSRTKKEVQINFTPQRVSENVAHASLYHKYTFEDLVKESDLIARVEISNWLGDVPLEGFPKTLFQADIIESYSGTAPKNITLIQSGNQTLTYANYPLFQIGDSLLLFLRKSNNDSSYYIVGNYPNVLYLSDDKQNTYVAKRFGTFDDITTNNSIESINFQSLSERESAIQEFVSPIEQSFTLEEIKDLIAREVE